MKTLSNKLKVGLLIKVVIFAALFTGNPNNVTAVEISGFIWLDYNADGVQNNHEPGFAHATPGIGIPNIALYIAGSTDLIAFSYLDKNSRGKYSFKNIPDGDYYLCVSNEFRELGLIATARDAGNDSIDSDFDFFPCSYNISISGNQSINRDLGLVSEWIVVNRSTDADSPAGQETSNQISGFILLNNNTVNLSSTVKLKSAPTNSNSTLPSVSLFSESNDEFIDLVYLDNNSNGQYRFENVPDGDYYLCVSNEFLNLDLAITSPYMNDDLNDHHDHISPCKYGIKLRSGQNATDHFNLKTS